MGGISMDGIGTVGTAISPTDARENIESEPEFWWDEMEWDYFFKEAKSDEKGNFKIPVPPGRFRIEVFADGFEMYSNAVGARPDETTNIKIQLRPARGGYSQEFGQTGTWDADNSRIQWREEQGNAPQSREMNNIKMFAGQIFNIDIDELFIDMDNDTLNFEFGGCKNVKALYDPVGRQIRVEAPEDWEGEEEITVYASDGETTAETTIPVEVQLDSPAPRPLGMFAAFYAVGIVAALGVLFLVSKYQTKEDE
jgi:hypothetical protein